MFGYITVNKEELKIKEYYRYRSYYCGLCKELKSSYGFFGQLSLTYDMTFLILLLTGLYEPRTEQDKERCMVHPFQKQEIRKNVYTEYAADMNVLLSYYKSLDDWNDEKKVIQLAYTKLLKKKRQKKDTLYESKEKKIQELLAQLSFEEKKHNTDLDQMAGLFGKILAEVFVCKEDEWKEYLYQVGFYLGKFIYLLDAYDDLEQDQKKKLYNPLENLCKEADFEETCQEILTTAIARCCQAFEKLPILQEVEILRNVLYSGVWNRYEQVRRKKGIKEKQNA